MIKAIIIIFVAVITFCLFCILGAALVKASGPVIEISDMHEDDLVVEGFELKEKAGIDVYAIGAGSRYSNFPFAYGWIIDAETRKIVWTMQDDCDDVDRQSRTLSECWATFKLPAGKYETYYYVGRSWMFTSGELNISINDLGDLVDFVGDIFGVDEKRTIQLSDEDLDELVLIVKADGEAIPYTPVFEKPPGSIVYFNRPERDEYHHQGFTLKDEIDLDIYAIGEFSESYDLFVDGGWIIDAGTREVVWSMDEWNTERAGGAGKNRFFRDVVTLPAGDYIAYYGTDDSHDVGEWNSPPPADPMNYGMSIAVANREDLADVVPYEEALNATEIVSLTRMRDGSYERASFTLNEDARIHIVALGERAYTEERMVDYGWITDAESLEKVWVMTSDNSRHAGGAAKNCRFDGIIELPAGIYTVFYRTDDSHAYGDWNSAPPFDKRSWGITVSGFGPDFDASSFSLVDDFQPFGSALVSMTSLGDDEDVDQSFTLDTSTRIRIMALGEGKSGHMYDYGWIENNETDEIVWEMTYRKTRHAGGADKNREVVANITLEPGSYTAYFITDGSHSFDHFNASPPDDPDRWGMIITKK